MMEPEPFPHPDVLPMPARTVPAADALRQLARNRAAKARELWPDAPYLTDRDLADAVVAERERCAAIAEKWAEEQYADKRDGCRNGCGFHIGYLIREGK